jgi:hypothetical protein
LPLPKTENLKKSFSYNNGAKLWTSLPKDLRECKSPLIIIQKQNCRSHLLEFCLELYL